ncbi:hypothetical protein HDU98_010063 [Podochytrium sp. JEL0797]|nr:hypothetical protein HDU98_010063 [Podochytrium sp. JEL0797]
MPPKRQVVAEGSLCATNPPPTSDLCMNEPLSDVSNPESPNESPTHLIANERKAAQEDAKNAAAASKKEADEEAKWGKGAKKNESKEDEQRKKVAEAAAKKAERDAMLAAEEAEFSKKKPSAKAAAKPQTMQSMVAKMAQGMAASGSTTDASGVESFGASGIDAAIALLDLTTSKPVAAAQAVEKHPERRMKSAWAAFEERELPLLKKENPSLRLSQLKQMLQKMWKKSPENPMNAELVGTYDMTAQEVRDKVEAKRGEDLERMKV